VDSSNSIAETLAGPARDQHTWTALDGKKYAAIGTSKILAIYYESEIFLILHRLKLL
jgi:hypothetical protein